jgi:hypothetical protein
MNLSRRQIINKAGVGLGAAVAAPYMNFLAKEHPQMVLVQSALFSFFKTMVLIRQQSFLEAAVVL